MGFYDERYLFIIASVILLSKVCLWSFYPRLNDLGQPPNTIFRYHRIHAYFQNGCLSWAASVFFDAVVMELIQQSAVRHIGNFGIETIF